MGSRSYQRTDRHNEATNTVSFSQQFCAGPKHNNVHFCHARCTSSEHFLPLISVAVLLQCRHLQTCGFVGLLSKPDRQQTKRPYCRSSFFHCGRNFAITCQFSALQPFGTCSKPTIAITHNYGVCRPAVHAVRFIVSLNTAALSRSEPASTETCCYSCSAQGPDKKDIQYTVNN